MDTNYEHGARWEGIATALLLVLPALGTGVCALVLDLPEEHLARIFVALLLGGLALLPIVGWSKGLLGGPAGPPDEIVGAVQQALMWARKDRSLMRDVRREPSGEVVIRIGTEQLPPGLWGRSGASNRSSSRTGDADLDAVLQLGDGAAGAVLAALDASARAALRDLVGEAEEVRIDDGVLEARYSADGSAELLTGCGTALIELVEALVEGSKDVPRGLALRFREEASPSVREAALTRLLHGFPNDASTAEVGAEVLAGAEPRFGLIAAAALDRPADAARFKALLEGQRGRLAVSTAEGGEGGLALASEAGPGALSEASSEEPS